MINFKLFWGFGDGQTDGQTDERTLVVVESLSRLKNDGRTLSEFHKKPMAMQ